MIWPPDTPAVEESDDADSEEKQEDPEANAESDSDSDNSDGGAADDREGMDYDRERETLEKNYQDDGDNASDGYDDGYGGIEGCGSGVTEQDEL